MTVHKLQKVYDDLYDIYPPTISRSRSGLTLVEAPQPDTEDVGGKPWWKTLFESRKKLKTDPDHADDDDISHKIQGLYMYGGVGCGKTMLMDMFVGCAPHSFKVHRLVTVM